MAFELYWNILIKRWKIILICFLLVGLGAFIASKLMTRLYQSSALVQVVIRSTVTNNNQSEYNNLMASDQLVQTEATLATSDSVLRDVASHYTNLSVVQLAREVSSTSKLNTQLFEIDVVDPSPTRSASLANDIAKTLIDHQQQMIQRDNEQAQQQIKINLDQTSLQINDITEKIFALQAKGKNQGQVAQLQAQLSGLQQHYTQWQIALAQLDLAQAQSGNPLQVVQPARPATSPVYPNILLNTAGGLLVGLLLGMLLAVLFEQIDTRVRTPEALSDLLKLPTLATVSLAKSSKIEDVINIKGRDSSAETYRILRTNLGFAGIDKPLHSLVVTSAQPGDGKSVIAANLAIFTALADKQTLLIDADLRRPSQHALFNLPFDRMGLSNALLAFGSPETTYKAQLASFVHAVGIPNLWVMPTGPLPPNPSELLDSKAMQRFLTVIANCGVEIVIFDTPPILGLSDTSILASKVDGALAVVDMTRATKGKLKQLKAALTQTGVDVLGCVANKYRGSRNEAAYSNYYYYQIEEQNDREKQAKNGHITPLPGSTLSSVSPSSFEQRKKSI